MQATTTGFDPVPVAVGAGVGACVLLAAIVVIVVWVCRKRKAAPTSNVPLGASQQSNYAKVPQLTSYDDVSAVRAMPQSQYDDISAVTQRTANYDAPESPLAF
jgi:negative regulator of sigma E activity